MATSFKKQLEEMKRELARQDEQWARAKSALSRLGDVRIVVPRETLDAIGAHPSGPVGPVLGVRA